LCEIAVASRFQALPRAGGLLDQDAAFIDDLRLYMRGRAAAAWEAKNNLAGTLLPSPDALPTVVDIANAMDAMDIE
jgi:hypothetical protein